MLAKPEEQPEDLKKIMVVSLIPPNRRMVEAIDEYGNTNMVDVGNNTTFAVGDEIRVGPHESGYPDVWQLLSGLPKDKRRPQEPE